MIRAIVIIATICCVFSFGPKDTVIFEKFQAFMEKHNKSYNTIEEFTARFKVFKANYLKLDKLAAFPDEKSFTLGMTKFSDLTPQEFKRTYLNLNSGIKHHMNRQTLHFESQGDEPTSFDYREKGVIGAVKDQGSCGSCWAFSAVGNIEGVNAIKTGKLLTLSEQQLVDCDRKVDEGCNGGDMDPAFEYVMSNGLELQSDYPYKARDQTCKYNKSKAVVHVNGFGDIIKDDAAIQTALLNNGPLAVGINAEPLQFYDSGILDLDADDCDPEYLNHGVVLVGYGEEKGVKFFIIRNSWGKGWGESGYFRIKRTEGPVGVCGINSNMSTAIIQ
jgi:cathepsin F